MSGVEVSGAGAAREQMAEAIEEFGNFGQFFDEPCASGQSVISATLQRDRAVHVDDWTHRGRGLDPPSA
jgi:hypothetical protein